MEGLGGPAQRVGEALGAHGHDHELLEVHVAVGMGSAVEHVEHGGGEHGGVDAAQVAVEGNLERLRDGSGGGHGDGEDGVGAQLGLVWRAVQGDHGLVDEALVGCVQALEFRRNDGFNIGDGLQHALAQIVALVPVAQFHGLMLAGGSARGHNCTAQSAAFQDYVSFHGRIAARVKNFARTDGNNFSHIGPHDAMQQPVIQLGTAIHGKRFSGSTLNRVQKLLHDRTLLSVQRLKGGCSLGILANRAPEACVMVVTGARMAAGSASAGLGRLPLLIRSGQGTWGSASMVLRADTR